MYQPGGFGHNVGYDTAGVINNLHIQRMSVLMFLVHMLCVCGEQVAYVYSQ